MTEVLRRPPITENLPGEWDKKNKGVTDDALFDEYTQSSEEVPAAYTSMSPVPLTELLNRKQRRHRDRLEKRERRMRPGATRRRLGVAALCLTTSLGLAYEGFMFDQNTLAKMAWGSNKAEVTTLYEHHEDYLDPETYVYVIPGTGIKDAAPRIANPLEPSFSSIPNVKYMSLKEGTHPQIEDTHSAIISTIDKENPPQRIVLYGMSAGGKESLDLAAFLRDRFPDIDIIVMLSSSPYDQDSAYQLRGPHNVLPMIADLSAELNLRGGPVTRFMVEMYDRRHQCWDDDNIFVSQCIALAKRIAHDKLSSDSSTNELFEWQVEWTRVNSAGRNISVLKNETGRGRTAMLYIETTKDSIVDDKQALAKYKADATKNNIPFDVISLDVTHASEQANAKLYNEKVVKKYLSEIDDIYAQIDAQNLARKELSSKTAPTQLPTVAPGQAEPSANIASR
jgi:hypothetical protein